MKGFLRRDFYLIRSNLWFYLCFLAVFGILAIFTDFSASFSSIYIVIFAMSSILGLFNYDDYNGWLAYAAAMPNGRAAAVNARYLLCLVIGLCSMVCHLLLLLLDIGQAGLGLAVIYSGVFFLYSAIAMPVSYYFGGTKARVVLIIIVAVLGGGAAMAGSALTLSTQFGHMILPSAVYFTPVVGLAALLVSLPVSRRIVAKKEL